MIALMMTIARNGCDIYNSCRGHNWRNGHNGCDTSYCPYGSNALMKQFFIYHEYNCWYKYGHHDWNGNNCYNGRIGCYERNVLNNFNYFNGCIFSGGSLSSITSNDPNCSDSCNDQNSSNSPNGRNGCNVSNCFLDSFNGHRIALMTYISLETVVVLLTVTALIPVLAVMALMSVMAVMVAMAIITVMVIMAVMAITDILPFLTSLDGLKGLESWPRRWLQLCVGQCDLYIMYALRCYRI